MRVTFDWNCVIEVEEGRPQAQAVRELVQQHQLGRLEVALLATSASENMPPSVANEGRRFPRTARLFKDRIDRLGWGELPIVSMPAIYGLTYHDFANNVGDGEAFERDFSALWKVIAPNFPRKPEAHLLAGEQMNDEMIQSPKLAKWRNIWCDVMSAYSHIQAGRDVFVTLNTRDFQRKSEALASLGMTDICDPKETLRRLLRNGC